MKEGMVVTLLLLLLSGSIAYLSWFKGAQFQEFVNRVYSKSPMYGAFETYMKSDYYLWPIRIVTSLMFIVLLIVITIQII